MKKWILKHCTTQLLILVCTCTMALSQVDRTIEGVIVDELGAPVPGATVVENNTTNGTITDINGLFTLNVTSAEAVLKVSFVGYLSEEVPINGRTTVDISLVPDIMSLGEVIVIGYGTVTKRDLTGSVSVIKDKELVQVPVLNLNQAMQGRAAGVQVTQNMAQPGGSLSVRIRGNSSINGNNDPLYVIDGFIGGNINTVDPSNIESINILKDAAATSIYGSRGANGVVLITTKTGKAGQNKISFDAYYGVQKISNKLDLLGPKDYAIVQNAISEAAGGPVLFNPDTINSGTNWQDELFQTAPMQNYNLSASGGTDKITYMIGGNYIRQDGIIPNSGFNRFNVRANVDSKISEKLSIGMRLGASQTNRSALQNENSSSDIFGPVSGVINASPLESPYDANGELKPTITLSQQLAPNPLFYQENIINENRATLVNGSFYLNFEIVEGLKFHTSIGYDVNNYKNNGFKPSYVFEVNDGNRNRASIASGINTTWLSENTLTYNKKFGENSFQVLGGFTAQAYHGENLFTTVYDFAIDEFEFNNLNAGATIQNLGSGMSAWQQLSFIGRINYSLKNKYLFQVNGRYDGSSKFGINSKWGFFPSASAGWVISDEAFMQDIALFSNLKLRASYGVSGSDALAPYSSISSLTAYSTSGYVFGNIPVNGYVTNRLPSPDLRWESTTHFDIGLDMSVLNGRLDMTVDYYNMSTQDLFLTTLVSNYTGDNSLLKNIGNSKTMGSSWVSIQQLLILSSNGTVVLT